MSSPCVQERNKERNKVKIPRKFVITIGNSSYFLSQNLIKLCTVAIIGKKSNIMQEASDALNKLQTVTRFDLSGLFTAAGDQ